MPDSKRRKMGLPTKIQKVEVMYMEENERVEEIDATAKEEPMNEGSVITSTSSERVTPDSESTVVHYEPNHATGILGALHNGAHSDIVLKVDGTKIPAHKCILMASSNYFREVLAKDSSLEELEIVDCPSSAVRELIDYVYTSRLNITQTSARDLLSVACRLELASAQSALEMFLKMRMTTPLALQTMRRQRTVNVDSLLEVARNYALARFDDITAHADFLLLPFAEVESLVSSSELNVKSEESVYNAVLKWVKSDLEARVEQLAKLLEHVRLPLAKPQFLLDVVEIEPLIRQNSDCGKLINEARRYHMLIEQRPLLQSPRTVPRKSVSKKQIRDYVVVLGGLNRDKQQMHDCFYFRPPVSNSPAAPTKDGVICRPQRLESPPINQTTYCVAEINNLAVLTGGIKQSAIDEVHAYIPSLEVWQQMAPMSQARFLHASTAMDGFLYVAGGLVNNTTRLSSVERWNPNNNKWEDVASLPVALSSLCLVACKGRLYSIGGMTDGSKIVSSVYCYDPVANYWRETKPLPEPERGVSAVSVENKIYSFGDACRFYCFDPDIGEWKRLKDTNGGHTHGASTVFKDRIYVAGGLHCSEFINRTVEVYDYGRNQWTNVAILPTPVYAHGLIALSIESP